MLDRWGLALVLGLGVDLGCWIELRVGGGWFEFRVGVGWVVLGRACVLLGLRQHLMQACKFSMLSAF